MIDKPNYHLDGGRGDCHLYIINAPDHREEMVYKTCRIARNAFTTICILNKDGAIFDRTKVSNQDNIKVYNIRPLLRHQFCFQIALESTKIDDYLMLLDSDELLSQKLIKYLKNKQYLKYKDANIFNVNMIPHFYDDFKDHLYKQTPDKMVWVRPSLVKRDINSIVASSGTHASLSNSIPKIHEMEPEICTIHCKNVSMILFSTIVFSLSDPDNHGIPATSENYKRISQFLQKYNIDVNDDKAICAIMSDRNKVFELRDFIDNSLDEPLVRDINRFIRDHDAKMIVYDFTKCKDKCCAHLTRSM